MNNEIEEKPFNYTSDIILIEAIIEKNYINYFHYINIEECFYYVIKKYSINFFNGKLNIPNYIKSEKSEIVIINYNIIPFIIMQSQINSVYIQLLYRDFPHLRDGILVSVLPNILDISKNKFGKHVIGAILRCKEKDKVDKIFLKLTGNIKELAMDYNGAFVIQELIKNIDENQLKKISKELVCCEDFKKFIKDKNVTRVIQELIKRQDKNANDEICKIIWPDFIPLCTNPFTSFIIEKLILNCNESNYNKMKEKCLDNLLTLIENSYGAYIICSFIKNNIDELFESIKNDVFKISQTQFGVLVIREIINNGNEIQINQIRDKIVNTENCLISLSKHEYGNFVIQNLLQFLDENTKMSLKKGLESVKEHNKYANFVWYKIR